MNNTKRTPLESPESVGSVTSRRNIVFNAVTATIEAARLYPVTNSTISNITQTTEVAHNIAERLVGETIDSNVTNPNIGAIPPITIDSTLDLAQIRTMLDEAYRQ